MLLSKVAKCSISKCSDVLVESLFLSQIEHFTARTCPVGLSLTINLVIALILASGYVSSYVCSCLYFLSNLPEPFSRLLMKFYKAIFPIPFLSVVPFNDNSLADVAPG